MDQTSEEQLARAVRELWSNRVGEDEDEMPVADTALADSGDQRLLMVSRNQVASTEARAPLGSSRRECDAAVFLLGTLCVLAIVAFLFTLDPPGHVAGGLKKGINGSVGVMANESSVVSHLHFKTNGTEERGTRKGTLKEEVQMEDEKNTTRKAEVVSTSLTPEETLSKFKDCHTAVEGELCYSGVTSAMQEKFLDHRPNRNSSTFEAIQLLLHRSNRSNCPMPCKVDEDANVGNNTSPTRELVVDRTKSSTKLMVNSSQQNHSKPTEISTSTTSTAAETTTTDAIFVISDVQETTEDRSTTGRTTTPSIYLNVTGAEIVNLSEPVGL